MKGTCKFCGQEKKVFTVGLVKTCQECYNDLIDLIRESGLEKK